MTEQLKSNVAEERGNSNNAKVGGDEDMKKQLDKTSKKLDELLKALGLRSREKAPTTSKKA
jgi:hypothetical protein